MINELGYILFWALRFCHNFTMKLVDLWLILSCAWCLQVSRHATVKEGGASWRTENPTDLYTDLYIYINVWFKDIFL